MGEAIFSGEPTISPTAAPQRQPARASRATSGRMRARFSAVSARNSASSNSAARRKVRADWKELPGGLSSNARASPTALGTQGTPGRTKANNSSTSNNGSFGAVFSLPATKAACATSTAPERNSARASSKAACRTVPSGSASAAPPGAGAKAATSKNSFKKPQIRTLQPRSCAETRRKIGWAFSQFFSVAKRPQSGLRPGTTLNA